MEGSDKKERSEKKPRKKEPKGDQSKEGDGSSEEKSRRKPKKEKEEQEGHGSVEKVKEQDKPEKGEEQVEGEVKKKKKKKKPIDEAKDEGAEGTDKKQCDEDKKSKEKKEKASEDGGQDKAEKKKSKKHKERKHHHEDGHDLAASVEVTAETATAKKSKEESMKETSGKTLADSADNTVDAPASNKSTSLDPRLGLPGLPKLGVERVQSAGGSDRRQSVDGFVSRRRRASRVTETFVGGMNPVQAGTRIDPRRHSVAVPAGGLLQVPLFNVDEKDASVPASSRQGSTVDEVEPGELERIKTQLTDSQRKVSEGKKSPSAGEMITVPFFGVEKTEGTKTEESPADQAAKTVKNVPEMKAEGKKEPAEKPAVKCEEVRIEMGNLATKTDKEAKEKAGDGSKPSNGASGDVENPKVLTNKELEEEWKKQIKEQKKTNKISHKGNAIMMSALGGAAGLCCILMVVFLVATLATILVFVLPIYGVDTSYERITVTSFSVSSVPATIDLGMNVRFKVENKNFLDITLKSTNLDIYNSGNKLGTATQESSQTLQGRAYSAYTIVVSLTDISSSDAADLAAEMALNSGEATFVMEGTVTYEYGGVSYTSSVKDTYVTSTV